ncbi:MULTISPECIES: hypothetical protein [Streptomyces]|uniref:Uncharacterized protein n=2 Tax=root TaxID=1 RepID=F2R6C0_STRVP|nr:hypothetical protein [Streptomyces venezuelae]YP_010754238.1 hypothetical protein QEH31_gp26 [Streptomyces phage Chymera]AMS01585.1 hypothetical protein SEA_CHYMERA_26 [Streptomyces phage Chymera]APE22054.1 hypothetical protein vnz_14185 [Streptomyces venezuelae]QER99441.1 hypothetical protein DEJ43_14360 [Streptomyces venezuelae ATCC 10712]CCA56171.1 hypothetical protein SVEN_2885 [Streptomyces venezuelae ATCC 10712]
MRLDTFHAFAVSALADAPDVLSSVPWDRGKEHLRGIHVTLTTGAQVWIGVTSAAAPGDQWQGPEIPVEGEPPAEIPYPQLFEDGKKTTTPALLQDYLAAALTNSGSKQIASAAGYGSDALHPGFGVVFHDGARGFCLFHHTARQGQTLGGRAFDLQGVI